VALACVPGSLDETGKRCSSERPCGAGYYCVGGRCQRDPFAAEPAPKIDGQLDDWTGPRQVTFAGPTNTVHGRLSWNSEHLFVAFEVEDAELNAKSPNIWEDDSIEVFVDALNDKSPKTLPDDYHILVNINNAQVAEFANERSSARISTAVTFSGTIDVNSDRDEGYFAELAIPWSLLQVTPQVGMAVGFNLACDDKDASSPWSYFDLARIAPDDYFQPYRWWTLRLLEGQATQVEPRDGGS
jgi:hypothetical protein